MPYPQNPYMNYQTGYQQQALPIMQSQASYPAPSSNGINWVSGISIRAPARGATVRPSTSTLRCLKECKIRRGQVKLLSFCEK